MTSMNIKKSKFKFSIKSAIEKLSDKHPFLLFIMLFVGMPAAMLAILTGVTSAFALPLLLMLGLI